MGVEINIDAESVQQEVVKAITESVIGEEIKKSIENITKASWSTKGVIEQAVSQVVTDQIHQIIRDKYLEQIKTLVGDLITEEEVSRMVSAAWEKRNW